MVPAAAFVVYGCFCSKNMEKAENLIKMKKYFSFYKAIDGLRRRGVQYG